MFRACSPAPHSLPLRKGHHLLQGQTFTENNLVPPGLRRMRFKVMYMRRRKSVTEHVIFDELSPPTSQLQHKYNFYRLRGVITATTQNTY